MTPNDISSLLRDITALGYQGLRRDTETIAAWHNTLHRFTVAQICEALDCYVGDATVNKYPPRAADLVRYATPTPPAGPAAPRAESGQWYNPDRGRTHTELCPPEIYANGLELARQAIADSAARRPDPKTRR